jgi:membrane fusion protein (multidrug efflux system)
LDVAESAVDPQTGAIRLRSIFPNSDRILLPGMFVRASVMDSDRAKEIMVPQKSVTLGPDGGRAVWIIDSDDQVTKREIRTGAAHGSSWVVLEGLEPGERIVVEGGMALRDGAQVQAEKIQPEN